MEVPSRFRLPGIPNFFVPPWNSEITGRVSGGGYGIYWPDLDEDLSTEGLLRGEPAARIPTKT